MNLITKYVQRNLVKFLLCLNFEHAIRVSVVGKWLFSTLRVAHHKPIAMATSNYAKGDATGKPTAKAIRDLCWAFGREMCRNTLVPFTGFTPASLVQSEGF